MGAQRFGCLRRRAKLSQISTGSLNRNHVVSFARRLSGELMIFVRRLWGAVCACDQLSVSQSVCLRDVRVRPINQCTGAPPPPPPTWRTCALRARANNNIVTVCSAANLRAKSAVANGESAAERAHLIGRRRCRRRAPQVQVDGRRCWAVVAAVVVVVT